MNKSVLLLITRVSFQVSKDDRSDIESSSEEETETPTKDHLKMAVRNNSASPKGENGTNGHFGSKSWNQNHGDSWHSTDLPVPPVLNAKT